MAVAKKIDLLNVFLVLISFLIAVKIPFKLFLFSYAVLGPLHYLTEIQWLKRKNYFMKASKNWFFLFLTIALIVALVRIGEFVDITKMVTFSEVIDFMKSNIRILILGIFLFSLSFLFKLSLTKRIFAFVASFVFAVCMSLFVPSWFIFIGVFLPTIFHVYLFTLLFVLYGSIRSKSTFGYSTVGLIILVPLAIYFLEVSPASYQLDQDTSSNYLSSGFSNINVYIAQLFGQIQNNNFDLISRFGIKIQIFIAFAYTYHYLNWFSKTSVIGWRDSLNKKNMLFIGSIWLASLILYLNDYKTGYSALFFLSYLHVVLEFPLNWITIRALIPKRA